MLDFKYSFKHIILGFMIFVIIILIYYTFQKIFEIPLTHYIYTTNKSDKISKKDFNLSNRSRLPCLASARGNVARRKSRKSKYDKDLEEIRIMINQMSKHNKKDLKNLYELIKIRNNNMNWKSPYIPESDHISYNKLLDKKYLNKSSLKHMTSR